MKARSFIVGGMGAVAFAALALTGCSLAGNGPLGNGAHSENLAKLICSPGQVPFSEADGWSCAYPGPIVSTIDIGSGGYDAEWTSVAVGSDGFPAIAFQGGSPHNLIFTHCRDALCTASTSSVVETDTNVFGVSLAIGTDGLPLISYVASSKLKVAHCDDVACKDARVSILDDANSSEATAIVIGGDGTGLIAYLDPERKLLVAKCTNLVCSKASTQEITTESLNGGTRYLSMAVGADGFGLIAFSRDSTNGVIHCQNSECSSFTNSVLLKGDRAGGIGSSRF